MKNKISILLFVITFFSTLNAQTNPGININGSDPVSIGSTTDQRDDIAIGNNANTANNGESGDIAIGTETQSTGGNSVAIGVRANASGDAAVALGSSATGGPNTSIATGDFSTALGSGSASSGRSSVAIGNATSSAQNSVAIGNGANATLSNTQTAAQNSSFTIGQVSVTETVNATGGEANFGSRLLTGVADGAVTSTSSQAINGSQLFNTTTNLDTRITVNNTAITTNTNNITQNRTDIDNIDGRVTTNTSNITQNRTDIDNIDGRVTTIGNVSTINSRNIKTNTNNIHKNTTRINVNTNNIRRNRVDINRNTENIGRLDNFTQENRKLISNNSTRLNEHETQLANHDRRISGVERGLDKANQGIAIAMATNPDYSYGEEKGRLSGGLGCFEGECGLAVSGTYRVGEYSKHKYVYGSVGVAQDTAAFSVGISVPFGRKSTQKQENTVIKKRVSKRINQSSELY